MTGFASEQDVFSNQNYEYSFLWEIKSVNGRNLDIKTKLPNGYEEINQQIRQKTSNLIKRGNIQINLQINENIKEPQIKINNDLLNALIEKALEIRKQDFDNFKKIAPEGLLAIKGVVETNDLDFDDDAKEKFHQKLLKTFELALSNMIKSRKEEGSKIAIFLQENLNLMNDLCQKATLKAQNISSDIMIKLKKQVSELLNGLTDIPEEKIIQETAFLAIKADIKEELDRLNAHISSALNLITAEEIIGRKFDFIAQEMLREVNTICSKANDIELTRIALDLKVIIDQIKEQIQNIE